MNNTAAALLLEQAMTLHRRGNLPDAAVGYRKVLALAPRDADALHLLGVVLEASGSQEEGIALIRQAIRISPTLADAYYNLGNILVRHESLEDAAEAFGRAVKLQPKNAPAANNLGGVLLRLHRYDEAERHLKKALELDPGLDTAVLNLAGLMESRGRFEQTLPLYNRVLTSHPDHVEAHYQKALALLSRGEFVGGWQEYAWRLRRPQTQGFYGQFPFPYWQGEPLDDREILVWTEQGLGDEVLTGTMLPDVVCKARRTVLICSPRMEKIFQRAFPSADVVAAGQPKDRTFFSTIDFQASVSELGRWLRPSWDRFDTRQQYLVADRERTAQLRSKYQALCPHQPLVGISWQSKSRDVEREKSAPVDLWSQVLRKPGFTFISLQYGDHAGQLAKLQSQGISVHTDCDVDPMADVDLFASQVAAMDLVISVSNTTVHFAGALGRPVWTLVPSNRGRPWYWFFERTESPWYPTMRLFRQPHEASWEATLKDVAAELDTWRSQNWQ